MFNIPITYVYPDGTKSTTRPTDGQVFIVWDNATQKSQSTWQWDDYMGQWFNASTGQPNKHNTATFVVPPPAISDEEAEQLMKALEVGNTVKGPLTIYVPKCECGARHTEFPQIHLRFCPLYA
jgi:hypothetical protein